MCTSLTLFVFLCRMSSVRCRRWWTWWIRWCSSSSPPNWPNGDAVSRCSASEAWPTFAWTSCRTGEVSMWAEPRHCTSASALRSFLFFFSGLHLSASLCFSSDSNWRNSWNWSRSSRMTTTPSPLAKPVWTTGLCQISRIWSQSKSAFLCLLDWLFYTNRLMVFLVCVQLIGSWETTLHADPTPTAAGAQDRRSVHRQNTVSVNNFTITVQIISISFHKNVFTFQVACKTPGIQPHCSRQSAFR